VGIVGILNKYGFEKCYDDGGGGYRYITTINNSEISVTYSGNIFQIVYRVNGIKYPVAKNIRIETADQLDFLLRNGAAGYLFKSNGVSIL